MMMRLLQAESAAGLNLFFTPLSCHRVGCGLQGTVSRKSSSSPFYFKAKQRKNTPHSRRVENSSSQSNGKKVRFCFLETGKRLVGAVVLMGKSFLLV